LTNTAKVIILITILVFVGFGAGYLAGANNLLGHPSGSLCCTVPPPPPLQWTGQVYSVDSAGGHFSIANVTYGPLILSGANRFTLRVSLWSSQASELQYHETINVVMTYGPQERVIYYSIGNVTSVSTNAATILTKNTTFPFVIPLSWGPLVGEEVVLVLSS